MKEIFRFPFKWLPILPQCIPCKLKNYKLKTLLTRISKSTGLKIKDAAELFKTHPYEYYPNLWFDLDKQYEAQPGESYDQTKAYIKAVFDKAIA